jgi:hypothetical protein
MSKKFTKISNRKARNRRQILEAVEAAKRAIIGPMISDAAPLRVLPCIAPGCNGERLNGSTICFAHTLEKLAMEQVKGLAAMPPDKKWC